MNKLRRLSALLAIIAAFVAIGSAALPSRAQTVPQQTVPVYVPADGGVPPIGGARQPLDDSSPGPIPTAYPIPTSSPIDLGSPDPGGDHKIDPSFKVPAGLFGALLTGLLDNITGQITPFLNKIPDLGWLIYTRLAAISIILGILQTVILGDFTIASFVRYTYWRIVEMGIWRIIIEYTWSGFPLAGGYGWFSAIIAAFVNIGATVGGVDVSGTHLSPGGALTLQVLPGTIADMGVGLFSSIMALVTIGRGGLWDILGRSLDGTIIVSALLWCFGLISALYAMFVCGAIAFKYMWTVVKIYVYGCLSFLQGFGGSRRLSGIAGSFGNSAIVLGVELCVTVILVGIMWHVITGLTQALGFSDALAGVSTPGAPPIVISHLADLAYTAGSLAVLDLALTLWAYAMWRVPKDVSEFLAGKIQVQAGELRQAFQASPFLGAKMVGHGMNVLEQGGTRGPGAALGTAVAPIGAAIGKVGSLAGIGAVAGSGNEGGTAGIASGALKGFLLGGPTGAVAGALGSAVMSKMGGVDDKEGGSYSSGSANEIEQDAQSNPDLRNAEGGGSQSTADARGGGAKKAAGAVDAADVETGSQGLGSDAPAGESKTVQRRVIIDDDTVDVGSDNGGGSGDGSNPAPQRKTRRTTVEDELVTAMRAMTQALNANASAGGSAGQGATMAAAAAGGSRSPSRTSSGFNPLGEMSNNMSIGKMIMYKALYSQRQTPTPPPPHGDAESASLNIPATFGK